MLVKSVKNRRKNKKEDFAAIPIAVARESINHRAISTSRSRENGEREEDKRKGEKEREGELSFAESRNLTARIFVELSLVRAAR